MSPSLRRSVHLALETSGDVGSVAVGGEGEVLARVFLAERGAHAARIVPAIETVLAEAGCDRTEIASVVVGEGPGSFTGVRVAAATAKGLAHGLGCPLRALSSLAAAAIGDRVVPAGAGPWSPSPDVEAPAPSDVAGTPRYVLFDARGTRVYAACYRYSAGRLEELIAPQATDLARVLAGKVPGDAFFVGDAALRHRERIRDAGYDVLPAPAGMPTADGLLHLLAMDHTHPPIEDTAAWEPAYLRASSAERERTT